MLSPTDNITTSRGSSKIDHNSTDTTQHKRKIPDSGASFIERLLGPKFKRARRANSDGDEGRRIFSPKTPKMSDGKDAKVVDAKSKTVDKKDARKPSPDKARRKEVKARLNSEARGEIRPLAIGTLAMMGSALSNQGMCFPRMPPMNFLRRLCYLEECMAFFPCKAY